MIHEMEIEQCGMDFRQGQISAQDCVKFLDYLYDEMGTDTHENVYNAYEDLYIIVWAQLLN